ncbi:hypothetical protein OENI_950007 [Oenococcus oeni]|nr:hypothetical protein OENI_950007 [Oenococcus oeni]
MIVSSMGVFLNEWYLSVIFIIVETLVFERSHALLNLIRGANYNEKSIFLWGN